MVRLESTVLNFVGGVYLHEDTALPKGNGFGVVIRE